jgi:hypothetical protein
VFAYRLDEPIDLFDGLTPLNRWLAAAGPAETAWAITAVLALADAAETVAWDGDMRHLPLVGALPTRPASTPYLLVKQDNNGDTFIVTDAGPDWIGPITKQTHPPSRLIGGWEPGPDDPAPFDF